MAPLTDVVVVLAGGPNAPAAVTVPDGATVVAADSGADLALRLGLKVDVAVGDFDSISAPALAGLEDAGIPLERHPREKDATDLELALDAALGLGARRILVVAGSDGRVDHAFGQLLLLASDAYRDVEIDARIGAATVHVIRSERALAGARGELISLFALHEPAVGVVADGFVYPLRGETLQPGSSRGVSNVFAAEEARVTLERGVLLAVRPGSAPAGTSSS